MLTYKCTDIRETVKRIGHDARGHPTARAPYGTGQVLGVYTDTCRYTNHGKMHLMMPDPWTKQVSNVYTILAKSDCSLPLLYNVEKIR